MNFDKRFEESGYSLEDLEMFRDENGFIDLTQAGGTLSENSREYIGNQERIKNWVNFNGTKTIIKGEALFDGEKNYGIYAELIVEEIAKKMGIPAAHYDLVKMLNENGEEVQGVLSVSVVDRDKNERLDSLHAIIGEQPPDPKQQEDTTGFEYTVDKLRTTLLEQGFGNEQVENLILEYKKRTAFFLRTADADKHPENIAFVRGIDEAGNPTIEMAPVFDSESALLLDINKTTIDKLMGDGIGILQTVGGIYPRIAVCKEKDEGGLGELWADTLEAVIEDDSVYDYVASVINQPIDMDEILDNVEKRIGAKLPMQVREISKAAYNFRGEEMEQVLDGSYLDLHETSKATGNPLLESLVGKSEKSVGTTDLSALFQALGLQMNLGKQNKDEKEQHDDELSFDDD